MTFLSKYKFIFIIVGVAVIAEAIWVFRSYGQNLTLPVPVTSQVASIILSVPRTTYNVGEKIPVSININSTKATDGTDVILNFDPKLLTITTPIEVGTIYDDYPLNTFDATLGKVSVSGISSGTAGKVAQGLFGTVVFEAKAPGKAKISVDFTKGNTIDSNIIETKTAKDLLGKIGNVEVEIK